MIAVPSDTGSTASSGHASRPVYQTRPPSFQRQRTNEFTNTSYFSGVSASWMQERIGDAVQQRRISPISHIFQHHTRAITDINWSPFEPDILASCGIDTWTWVWDLRTCSGDAERGISLDGKPVQGYAAWNSSATQVKWNRASPHRLATAVDNKVLIWDSRKGALPLCTIEAHESRIYGLDWSRDLQTGSERLLTCSLDGAVKFWDLAGEHAQQQIGRRELVTEPEAVVETPTPVWRARHLPFGEGVMTLPQRGDFGLSMWSKAEALERREGEPSVPVHRFEGHTDMVKEYLFRTRGGSDPNFDDRAWQLLTWGRDETLRLWPVPESLTKAVGHKPGTPIRVRMTRKNAKNISYRIPPCEQDPLLTAEESDTTSLHASSVSTSQGVRSTTTGVSPASYSKPIASSFTAPGSLTRGVLRPANASASVISPSSQSPLESKIRPGGMSAMRPAGGDRSSAGTRRAMFAVPERTSRTKVQRSKAGGGFMTLGAGYGPFRFNRTQGATADPLGWISGVKEEAQESAEEQPAAQQEEPPAGKSARSLSDEIMDLSKKLPRLTFEKVEIAQRSCELALSGPWGGREPIFVRISFTFPSRYPNAPLEYSLERSAKINLKTRAFMLRNLARLSREHARAGKPSLEACARFLLGESTTRETNAATIEDDEESSEEDIPVVPAPPSVEEAPAGEDRFLTSYDALANAMADLARKSARGRLATDSDVLQLMSSNFIHRRKSKQG